jgi:hypothetical protein
MQKPRYIFLSHNSEDKPEVEKLVKLIESHESAKKHNIKVWLDKNNLPHGEEYSMQFSENIYSENTCGFILFVPNKSIDGFVKHEIGAALKRHLDNQKVGILFPILPVYPKAAVQRPDLPTSLSNFNYRENVLSDPSCIDGIVKNAIEGANSSSVKKQGGNSPEDETKSEPIDIPRSEQWLCFDLTVDDNTIISQTEFKNHKTEHPLDILLDASRDAKKQISIMQQLFPSVFADEIETPKRLRIRTDIPELAMLPWAMLHKDIVVELSLLATNYRPDFDSLNVSTPLVIIPTDPPEIASNTHYRLLQEYCEAYFNIRGPIPRVTNSKSLKQAIYDHQPDFIYLYARVNGEQIQLDESTGDEPLTLAQLGNWIEAAEIRPMVVLSMLGSELKEYPAILAKQCRLLWIQSTASKLKSKSQQVEDNLANTLEKLTQEPDLVKNINTNFNDQRICHHLWVSGQSPQLDTSSYQMNQQLRAALLRVLLGRKILKNNLCGEVNQANKIKNSNCLSYAVSGDESACPFDVPAQLQQRLDWDNPENGLPIISFHLPLTLSNDLDHLDSIEILIDSSLVDRAGDIRGTFQSELDRRGLAETECCIALNWNIKVPAHMSVELSDWLKEWGDFMRREVIEDIPSNALLLNAICLQVADLGTVQEVQDTANNELQRLRRQGIGLIRVEDALGKLKSFEISDFFEDNPNWREALKLDTYDINPYDYADWVHQRSNQGEFEQTVKIIWQQYQQNYEDFRA